MKTKAKKLVWHGVLVNGDKAPKNTDKARLDYISRKPGVLLNSKAGVRVKNVPGHWQPGVREAIDAAMETDRRELRANGLDPVW